jgi:hypothetical protein
MTLAQRTAIANPAIGLIVYESGSVTEGLWINESTGWHQFLTNTGSQSISGSLTATSFTGSLFGTSSWANNVTSASFASTASYASTFIISSSLYSAQSATGSASTTTTLVSVPTSSYTAGFFDYTVSSGSNARAGTIMSVWNGSSVQFTDNSTLDIGNTNDVTMSIALSGGNVLLRSTTTAFQWSIKTTYRLI